MNTFPTTASLLTHSLSWALLHSLWQGLIIYGTLYVLLKALPNIASRIKYYLSMGAFTLLFLWFADTWSSQYQKLKGATVYITQAGVDNANPVTYSVQTITGGESQTSLLHQLQSRMEHYMPFMMLIYTIGLLFMLFRFLVNSLQVSNLKRQGVVLPEQHWNELLLKWKTQLDITRPVKLLLSTRINVPMMMGVVKPVILLPIATINHLTTEQVESILMHELAHIRRHDYLLNILQAVGETVLFFNPFVWLMSAIIRREREHCCDDLVVECAGNPLPYARALALLEKDRIDDNNLVLAATGNKSQLFHRIKRIMEMKKKDLSNSQLTIVIVAIIAVIFTLTMFTFTPSSMAQKAKTPKGDTTQKKSVYKYKTVTVDDDGKETVKEEVSDKPIKHKDHNAGDAKAGTSADDDKDSQSPKTKSYAYSYSYSNDDGPDVEQIMKEVHKATKEAMDAVSNIDMKEIQKEIERAQKEINDIDWDQIRKDINEGIKDINKELDNADLDGKIKKELERGRKALESAQEQMSKQLKDKQRHAYAYAGINTVTDKYGTNFDAMLDEMAKDGLIDRSDYKIKKVDGELYIDGKRQPESVYNKYRHYLREKNMTLKGKGNAISIAINDEK